MAKITFGNVTVNGTKIIVGKNQITVDGKDYSYEYDNLKIHIEGDVEYLEVNACQTLTVSGDSDITKTTSGDIEIYGNSGTVETVSGDVEISGNVNGDIKTMSGDIDIDGNHHGSITTMSGDVNIG